MGLYARYVLPRLIDAACGQPPMAALRARYVPRARGRVLEIGIGTGHNLPYYGADVTSVTGIDPAAALTATARRRASNLHCPVHVLEHSGESIPADDRSFDTVVCTWTLCSIPAVARALAEMRRVLTPEGRFLFVEHGRAPDAAVARWQDRLDPLWRRIGGGCHLGRPIGQLIADGGFVVEHLETGYLPGPRIATFMYHGEARTA
jgi:ubiquinone/menaquinone biosynthesis C-methylase UbiE